MAEAGCRPRTHRLQRRRPLVTVVLVLIVGCLLCLCLPQALCFHHGTAPATIVRVGGQHATSSQFTTLRQASAQHRVRLRLRERETGEIDSRRVAGAGFVGAGLVGSYIVGDVGLMLAAGAATQRHSKPAVMLAVSALALLCGTAASCLHEGCKGLWQALSPRRCLCLAPVACLFSLSTFAQLRALQVLSPVIVKVLYQLKLPLTMLFSTVLLKRSYSFLQMQALMILFLAVSAFYTVSSGLATAPTAGAGVSAGAGLLGVALVCAAVCLNVLGSLVAEKAFRDNPDVPVYTTVANLKVGEVCMACALLTLVPSAPLPWQAFRHDPMQVFAGFDATTWRLVALLLADSLLSAFVVQRLSSVAKNVAKATSVIAVYATSVALGSEVFSLPLAFIALIVVQGSGLFAHASDIQAATQLGS